MIMLKEGAKINGMRPEILLAVVIANEVYNEQGYDCVVTELTGGKHGHGSLHYTGLAVDIRTRHISSDLEVNAIVQKLKVALGEQYDVVLEKDHIHIEYQPKK